MAEVFLARMSGVGGFAKLLVIKRILPHLGDDPEFVEMFMNEGRVTARLGHPNICQVYELGEVNGEVFLAMEHLEGLPWSDLVALLPRGRGVELRCTAAVLGQICEGLRYAHEFVDVDGTPMPIVHRDVSPQNLFITAEGVCKLLDFGVSKVLTEGTRTRTGMLKGKLPYMAPEQIRGESIDARADVFSMGVVLWESLVGERLFARDSDYKIWRAITEEDVPRVTARVPNLPADIDVVVARALERDRERRYPSIRAFAAELRAVTDRVGGPFDPATLRQIVKSLGAGKLAARSALVGRAIGRPVRTTAPPPLPSAITEPNPIVEPSVTDEIALRDASIRVRRRSRGKLVALAIAGIAAVAAVVLAVWPGAEPTRVAAVAPDAATSVDADAVADPPPPEIELEPEPAGSSDAAEPPTEEPAEVTERPRRRVRRTSKKPRVDATVAEPGFYSVDSRPYAMIFIDDKPYGSTPLFRVALPAGKHRVRAVREDGKTQRLTITIEPRKLFSSGRLTW